MTRLCQFGAGRIGQIHAANVAGAGASLAYVVDVNVDAAAALAAEDMRVLAAKVDALSSGGMDDIEIPAFLRRQAD